MPARWMRARSRSSVATVLGARFRHEVAPFVADEAVAIECLALFLADAVGRDHGHAVGHRMADHRAAPHAAGVEVRIIGFGADRGRIEQHLRAHQRHAAGRFRIPLVPADADADRAVAGVPHLEAAIAGAEIIFFLIARPVGDMALAIDAHDLALVVDHGERIIIMLAIALEKAGRDIDAQILGQLAHFLHG